jgi:hypothetical protein
MFVILVPFLLMATYFLPALLNAYRSRVLILSGVSAIVVILALLCMLPKSIPNDALLVTIPVLDAGIFVISHSFFRLLTGRYPLEFDGIRGYGRINGNSRIPDRIFWMFNILMSIFVGIAICISFKLGLPTKSGSTGLN